MSDDELGRALGLYVGMVDHVLTRPERWLGLDLDPGRPAGRGRHVLSSLRRRVVGRVNPTSTGWPGRPVAQRIRWWTRRIALSAGTAEAVPRIGGLLADRLPVQDALGAVASDPADPTEPATDGRLERGGRTVWHLAQVFLELGDLFDQRPRGGLLPRQIGKVPAVGVAGGWLDERGAIRAAARRTDRLLRSR